MAHGAVLAVATRTACRGSLSAVLATTEATTESSIGATIAEPGESAHEVTARADAAMYEAKQAGRNATVCG